MSARQVPVRQRESIFDDNFFKSSLDEFQRTQEEMTRRSREWMEQGEREFREMTNGRHLGHDNFDRSSKESFRKFESKSFMDNRRSSSPFEGSSAGRPTTRSFADPPKSTADGPPSWSFVDHPVGRDRKIVFSNNENDNEVISVKEDKSKLEVSLDTSKYRPEELNVSVTGNTIVIEGNHEERAQSGEVMISRKFERKYRLPSGSRPEDVESLLSADGVLVVTAKKSLPSITVKINKR